MTQGAHKGGTRNLETHLEGQTGSQVPKGLSGAFLREKVAKNHEELCGTSYGSFCLNGGICYMIPTVSSPFCRKVPIPRTSSSECGASLVEPAGSSGCNKITTA
ncbi:pro-neuregulin-4, membrane-bound isoform isoform X7 [Empidonax traillii]|uniref:pro-neuregulin-4, membrane-bound isoform isoform X7 n=1 Tax=Empidonax traillii TaxID=164674 RepID=UPI000FFCF075|nr:pro-neuregulin-4, membrane-bound isoform isoform X7 [Empidonax traillii]